jgi:hypothetical protein
LAFGGDAAGGGEAGELAASAQDAVAGDEEGPGVGGEGVSDGAGGVGATDAAGDLAVGELDAGGDGGDDFQDAALEGGEGGPIEARSPIGPMFVEGRLAGEAEVGGEIVLEVGDEVGEPIGDGLGMEMAFVAEDLATGGEHGEDLAAELDDGQAGGVNAAEEGASGGFGEALGGFVFMIFPHDAAEAPSGGNCGHRGGNERWR